MRAAFANIVDYAGLFPPASCSMADAVRQYDGYRRSDDRWMLGRFVVAAIRLQELAAAVTETGISLDRHDPWRLTVVMGVHVPAELARIAAFGAEWEPRGIIADAIEYRVSSVGQIQVVGEQIPRAFTRYFEVPHTGPYHALVEAIGQAGALAKVRTGGTTPDLFPASLHLAEFVDAAVTCQVRFKATAGLHHPWCGEYALTYAPNAARQRMFGFVNLLLATTEFMRSGSRGSAQAILDEDDRSAFRRDVGAITWRNVRYTAAELEAAHRQAFVGFGSCSFREPVDELSLQAAA